MCGLRMCDVLCLCLRMQVCDVRHTASGNITEDKLFSEVNKAASEVLRVTGKNRKEVGTHDYELINQVGHSVDTGDDVPVSSPEDVEVGVEADENHDVVYGPEDGESEDMRPEASVPKGNLEHEPEAKRRRLANVHGSKERFAQVLRLQKYDGSFEEGDQRDHRENVTSIIEKLNDWKDMCTPHNDDEKWADMFRNTVFVDDVTGGNELDKNLVIEAGKTEMEFFKKMAMFRKVQIISTRWTDTDQGYRGNPNYRSRLVARETKKDKRQEKFLVAGCAKGQRQANPSRIGIFDVSRSYFYALVTRHLFINIPVGNKEMKAWLASYRSALMVRETLRKIGRPHAPSSWSRSGSRGAERPDATSCTRRGTSR